MTKLDFLYELREALSELPREDIERYVEYYSEMIDDRIDDGMSEADAVAAVGAVEDIAARILGETPKKSDSEKTEAPNAPPKRKEGLGGFAILLIILGIPVWLPLLVSALSVAVSLIASLFSVIIGLWAVEVSLWGCTIGGAIAGIAVFVAGKIPAGLALCGIAALSAGLSVFAFFACKAATRGAVWLTAKSFSAVCGLFRRKEGRR